MSAPILSMTGFGHAEGLIGSENSEQKYRIEVKTVNHRFLDLKLRLPRELSSAEMPLRAAIQAKLSRGAVDLKVERVSAAGDAGGAPSLQPNLALARQYHHALTEIQKALGLSDPIRAQDIAAYPDVLGKHSTDVAPEEAWKRLEPIVQTALTKLLEMRRTEGAALQRALLEAASDLESKITLLRTLRQKSQAGYPARVRERIAAIFEAHPLPDGAGTSAIQAVIEGRIAQELALIADRTDIEEELVRFQGHIEHLRKVLSEGGAVGRKLDFLLQELGREINTLGNKAQDYGMGEEVVQVKVKLEQIREQVMNLE